jgi:hypothetical protein
MTSSSLQSNNISLTPRSYSTQTVIVRTNLKFNLHNVFTYLPTTPYTHILKRRGRKPIGASNTNATADNPESWIHLPVGSILGIKYKWESKGDFKFKQKFFLNCTTIVILVEPGKTVNAKINNNGKIQMTGCKTENHFIDAMKFIYKHCMDAATFSNESLFDIIEGEQTTPYAVFHIVMKNMDFKLGFNIQRDKLYTFISENTSYNAMYLNMLTPSVNIKIPYVSKQEENIHLDLSTNEQKIILMDPILTKKVKNHTFLVFSSGCVIQSGSGSDMEKVYNEFYKIIMDNKDKFIENNLS